MSSAAERRTPSCAAAPSDWRLQLVERTHQLETTVRERDEARAERDARARELAQAAAEISGYKSTQAAREKALEEWRAELDTHFTGLASEALKFSTEEFRKQAAEQFKQHQELAGKDLKAREVAVENLVRPVRESLDKLREHVDASDKARRRRHDAGQRGRQPADGRDQRAAEDPAQPAVARRMGRAAPAQTCSTRPA